MIGWLVNELPLTELDSQFLSTSSIGSTFSLHVSATEEYNNTVVVCELSLRDPLSVETSDPAVLRVQGRFCLRVQGMYVSHISGCCAKEITKAPTNTRIFDYSFVNLLFDEENESQIFGGGASR